jgi:hypothetical protein
MKEASVIVRFILCFCFAVSFYSVSNASSFGDPGTTEISGSLSFANIGGSRDRISIVQCSPSFIWYTNLHLFFGPIIAYTGTFVNSRSVQSLEAGGQFGKAFKINSKMIYLVTGAEFLLTNDHDTPDLGVGIPIRLGIKQLITEHLGFDFSATYGIGSISGQRELIQNILFGVGISGFLY